MGKLEIAKRLKEYREKSGLTVYQVGERLGKSGKTVSAWENGRGQPDADIFLALCEIYNVNSVGVFFGEPDSFAPVLKRPTFQSKRLEYLISATGKDNLTELSTQTGVDVMTFTHWLSGQVQPPQDKVELLASFFGATSDYLMGLTDSPKENAEKKEGYLSDEALNIASLFDQADDRDKETVRNILGRYADMEIAEELHPNTDKKAI